MLKILIVTDNLSDQINGVVTTFTNIVRYANEDGYSIHFIDPSQFTHFNCPKYPQVKLSFPYGISKKIDKINPDFIHIATEGPLGLAARYYCIKRNLKFNTSYHTKFPEFIKTIYHIPECITYHYVRWFHSQSTQVLTTTDTMVDELKNHGFKNNVVSWTRGVDRSIFDHNLKQHQNQELVLLSVGRISLEKGLDDFCQLNIQNSKKIVVGHGPYLNELKEKYPDVVFLGKKTGVELAKIYAQADVFVFTSRVDTFGIVIIESISMGVPVAAYQVPGPIDIIEPGLNGYLGENLELNIKNCLHLDRQQILNSSNKWTWKNCWDTFKNHLVRVSHQQ